MDDVKSRNSRLQTTPGARPSLARVLLVCVCALVLAACRHPLEVHGPGKIVERLQGVRGCTQAEFQAGSPRCADNAVLEGNYTVSYQAIPDEGYVFAGWSGTACGTSSTEPYCEYDVGSAWVDFTNLTWPGLAMPATVAVFMTETQYQFEQTIAQSILGARCLNCHVEGGVSGHTRLVFDNSGSDDQNAANLAVFRDFLENVDGGGELILSKVRGGDAHGGGLQISPSSEEFAALSGFLTALDDSLPGDGGANSDAFWAGVVMSSSDETLRRAALILAGRLPTEQELDQARSGDLRGALARLMQGDAFHEFLVSGANDRLHTDALIDWKVAFDWMDAGTGFLPVYSELSYEAHVDGDEETMNAFYDWERKLNFGAARSPLELIAHVVENDKPYTQILTADYALVNPQLSLIMRSDVLDSVSDPTRFATGIHRGQIFQDDLYIADYENNTGLRIDSHGPYYEGYPHAGILNTPAYLSRYPSTETNRNRARARWTYLHFLGVDIEKSAPRTTDPAALADTDNPTLNNPSCAVCHQLHDPVGGTFQNYGNAGYFRDAWGGMDSLPETYKYPQWYDEAADDSPYEQGDTWYRDMRSPGLDGNTANDAGNSLQWLAQQIVGDDRFAVASVKFWWPALMGADVLEAPASSTDSGAAQRQAAFEVQSDTVNELARKFSEGFDSGEPYRLKDLLVEMLMSPWFRAHTAPARTQSGRATELDGIGSGRLLTPREMNNKTRALFGKAWNESEDMYDVIDQQYTSLMDTYRIYYGGIDSAGIQQRSRQLTSLMDNVAKLQGIEMACRAVFLDFERPDRQRQFFKGIDRYTSPVTVGSDSFDVRGASADKARPYRLSATLEPGTTRLRISFTNDYAEEGDGNDRNLVIDKISVTGPDDTYVIDIGAEKLREVNGFEELIDSGGGMYGDAWWNENGELDGWMLWSEGWVSIPLEIEQSGSHSISIEAWGQQAGPDTPRMLVELNGATPWSGTPGELAIKEKLVELHGKLLGEELSIDDEEIESSYGLLAETWLDRMENTREWFPDWDVENCYMQSEDWEWLETIGEYGRDPQRMMGTWKAVMYYLMTDFRYLHE